MSKTLKLLVLIAAVSAGPASAAGFFNFPSPMSMMSGGQSGQSGCGNREANTSKSDSCPLGGKHDQQGSGCGQSASNDDSGMTNKMANMAGNGMNMAAGLMGGFFGGR